MVETMNLDVCQFFFLEHCAPHPCAGTKDLRQCASRMLCGAQKGRLTGSELVPWFCGVKAISVLFGEEDLENNIRTLSISLSSVPLTS